MTIYSFHVFDKNCDPLYSTTFAKTESNLSLVNLQKLILGTTLSLVQTIRKVSPLSTGGYFFYETDAYASHTLTTLSQLRFIVLTSPGQFKSGEGEAVMNQIYLNLWIPFVVMNPLGNTDLYDQTHIRHAKQAKFGPGRNKVQEKRYQQVTQRERYHVESGIELVATCQVFDLALRQFVRGLDNTVNK